MNPLAGSIFIVILTIIICIPIMLLKSCEDSTPKKAVVRTLTSNEMKDFCDSAKQTAFSANQSYKDALEKLKISLINGFGYSDENATIEAYKIITKDSDTYENEYSELLKAEDKYKLWCTKINKKSTFIEGKDDIKLQSISTGTPYERGLSVGSTVQSLDKKKYKVIKVGVFDELSYEVRDELGNSYVMKRYEFK